MTTMLIRKSTNGNLSIWFFILYQNENDIAFTAIPSCDCECKAFQYCQQLHDESCVLIYYVILN